METHVTLPVLNHTVQSATKQPQDVHISKFMMIDDDVLCVKDTKTQHFEYITLRTASSPAPNCMCDLQTYLQRSSGVGSVEQSAYSYLEVLDKNADSRDTILEGLCVLHKKLSVGINTEY